jgi:hypothetical protein
MPTTLHFPSASTELSEWIALARDKVAGLCFGARQHVVHDSGATQIECMEKTRLPSADDASAPGCLYLSLAPTGTYRRSHPRCISLTPTRPREVSMTLT